MLWIIIAVIALVVLLYLSARFSGAETAITAISSLEVADLVSNEAKNAKYITKLKGDLDHTVVTILIGNNLVNVMIASLATLIANDLFGNLGVSIGVFVLTLTILIVGEITPKAYAVNNRVKLSQRNARWIYWMGFSRPMKYLVKGLIALSMALLRLVGMDTQEVGHLLVSDESIRQLASLGVSQGTVDDVEQEIIDKALDFAEADVSDLMVDRKDVFTIPSGTPLSEADDMLAERGFTRVPVVKIEEANGGNGEMTCLDEVMGLVHVKDLLGKTEGVIDDYARHPFITFPDREAAELFEEMREGRIHMALVCGEGGRLLGIITLEDLIEEVMGEIRDEVHEKQFPDGEPGADYDEEPAEEEEEELVIDISAGTPP
jgi:CBS domain containing-hemolysin-like protein